MIVDRRDDRPGLRARRPAAVRRHRRRHAPRGRLADRGRHRQGPRHAGRRRRRPTPAAPTRLSLPIGDLHAAGVRRRLHRVRRSPSVEPRRRRHRRQDFALAPQARRLRPRLPPDRVRLGRRDRSRPPLYGDEFVGRLHLPFDVPVLRRDVRAVFISDNGYLNFLGPDQFNASRSRSRRESDRTRRSMPSGRTSTSTPKRDRLRDRRLEPGPRLRDRVRRASKVFGDSGRVTSRSSSGRTATSTCSTAERRQPGRRPERRHRHRERRRHRCPAVLLPRGSPRHQRRLPLHEPSRPASSTAP